MTGRIGVGSHLEPLSLDKGTEVGKDQLRNTVRGKPQHLVLWVSFSCPPQCASDQPEAIP